ncbi:hypothetical protein BLNAU_9757 [Blattamonas nauphoetae]|uniref:Uncharacterized protein n=1 Tax=Blattamonas nauphoetae TaxID=2049346 RepID=A0ABQ9XV51_9EUKA|nr:hypothetical protein BLNAU_9757 [Blattamonas nauphoetae]
MGTSIWRSRSVPVLQLPFHKPNRPPLLPTPLSNPDSLPAEFGGVSCGDGSQESETQQRQHRKVALPRFPEATSANAHPSTMTTDVPQLLLFLARQTDPPKEESSPLHRMTA